MDFLKDVWNQISAFTTEYVATPIGSMTAWDVIDVVLLAVVLYELYRFTRNRRAGRVLIGLVMVVVIAVTVNFFDLPALKYLSRMVAASAFFCIVVVFHPEIRDALEHLGNCTLFNPRSGTISRKRYPLAKELTVETVDAVFRMSKSRTGALIVFEGLTKLGDFISTGKPVDARVSSHLLQNIFFVNAPLHDGAVIIRDMRVHAASCVLPATTSKSETFEGMGTRHRAAVGVTEVSDALVVVVSEQTGIVSVAQNGKLLRGVDERTLTDILMTYIAGNAYLRNKRANMRQEYLEMLERIGRVQTPKENPPSPEDLEKQIQSFIAEEADGDEAATSGEQLSADLGIEISESSEIFEEEIL